MDSWDAITPTDLVAAAMTDIDGGDSNVGRTKDENLEAVSYYLSAIARLMLARELREQGE